MTTRLTLDKAGRIALPKALLDKLQLGPGDVLELESGGERLVLLPLPSSVALTKERGVWGLRTGRRLSAAATDRMLRRVREERGWRKPDARVPRQV
jgi:AbrB family looped-hinge helix DNA binding protein